MDIPYVSLTVVFSNFSSFYSPLHAVDQAPEHQSSPIPTLPVCLEGSTENITTPPTSSSNPCNCQHCPAHHHLPRHYNQSNGSPGPIAEPNDELMNHNTPSLQIKKIRRARSNQVGPINIHSSPSYSQSFIHLPQPINHLSHASLGSIDLNVIHAEQNVPASSSNIHIRVPSNVSTPSSGGKASSVGRSGRRLHRRLAARLPGSLHGKVSAGRGLHMDMASGELVMSSRRMQPILSPRSWNRFFFTVTGRRFVSRILVFAGFFAIFSGFISYASATASFICVSINCLMALPVIIGWLTSFCDKVLLQMVVKRFEFLYYMTNVILLGGIYSYRILMSWDKTELAWSLNLVQQVFIWVGFILSFVCILTFDAVHLQIISRTSRIILLIIVCSIFILFWIVAGYVKNSENSESLICLYACLSIDDTLATLSFTLAVLTAKFAISLLRWPDSAILLQLRMKVTSSYNPPRANQDIPHLSVTFLLKEFSSFYTNGPPSKAVFSRQVAATALSSDNSTGAITPVPLLSCPDIICKCTYCPVHSKGDQNLQLQSINSTESNVSNCPPLSSLTSFAEGKRGARVDSAFGELVMGSRLMNPVLLPKPLNRIFFTPAGRVWIFRLIVCLWLVAVFTVNITAPYPILGLVCGSVNSLVALPLLLLTLTTWYDTTLLRLIVKRFEFIYYMANVVSVLVLSSYQEIVMTADLDIVLWTLIILQKPFIFLSICMAFVCILAFDALPLTILSRKRRLLILVFINATYVVAWITFGFLPDNQNSKICLLACMSLNHALATCYFTLVVLTAKFALSLLWWPDTAILLKGTLNITGGTVI